MFDTNANKFLNKTVTLKKYRRNNKILKNHLSFLLDFINVNIRNPLEFANFETRELDDVISIQLILNFQK
jgi:hypothetical protein